MIPSYFTSSACSRFISVSYESPFFVKYFKALCTASLVCVSTKWVFISVINQLDAQNLFHNKFYFMPLHVSSTCARHQEVKIALHSLWYHHTYRWPSRADDEHMCSKHVEA